MNIRNVNVIQGAVLLSSKKIRNALLILLLGFTAQANAQQMSEFYVPLPEASALTFFDNINTDAAAPMITRTDIVIRDTGTEIVFDPTADGYESQYTDDTLWAATTELWGDNDCTNGFNPLNVVCDAGTPDILNIGQVLVFDQTEVFSGDYFLSNRTVNLTRSLWPSVADTLLAGAFELFPTSQWGTAYVLPIGEDLSPAPAAGGDMFDQVAVTITASADNTSIQFDPDGSGAAAAITATLDRGEQIEYGIGAGVNGQALAILVGATIVADRPVQANVMTGDIGSNYEARFYTLFPNSLLSNEYYEAVGTSLALGPAAVFLYNPEPVNSITVEIYDNTDPQDATPTTVVIAANTSEKVLVPPTTAQGLTGLRFATTGGEVFSAYTVVDDNEQIADWGHVTTPVRLMGDTIRVGFAPGRDPTSASLENASPVWLIADLPGAPATQNIEVCVDAAGDGGALTDPFTSRTYDYSIITQPLDSRRLYDNGESPGVVNNNGGTQTGMLAFACDPGTPGDTALPSDVLLAAAWGQDPEFASVANPGFDVGTTIRTGSTNRLFIGDLIFEDLDGDGVQDLSEAGLSGVSVTITVANPLIDVDPNTAGIQNSLTILTEPDGTYLFDGLTQGETYTVSVVPPTNFLPVSDPDGMVDNQTVITLQTSTLTEDFGYSQAAIGDQVFLDIDGDGVQGVGEPGLPGVEVQLCTDGTQVVANDDFATQSYSNNLVEWDNNSWQETDDDNSVSNTAGSIFINGTEQLFLRGNSSSTIFPRLTRRIDLSGFSGAAAAAVVLDWTGNDSNYETNDLIEVQISTDGVPTFTTIGSFAGQTIDNTSGTSTFTFDPAGSSTVDIQFRVTNFRGTGGGEEVLFINDLDITATGMFCQTTTTDATGFYVFGGLIDATYTVTVDPNGTTLPTNVVQTADPDTPGAPDNMSVFTVASGVGSVNEDFGYQPSSIRGNVSDDAAQPLAGVTVQLYSDPNGDGDPSDGAVVATAMTDVSGDYEFINVPIGDYVLVEINPATLSSVSDGDSSPDAGGDQANTSITDDQIPVSLVAGEQDDDNDFVDGLAGSISGLVWLDEDQDGINDIPEAGLSNVIVELDDGVCTLGVNCQTVQTDQFGNYVFDGLPAGNYDVIVQTASLPAGLQNTAGQFGLPVRPVTLASGANVIDQNFGYIAVANTGIIGDRVWSDANADGIQDSGEAGINDVTVELLNSSGVVIATTETTADGDYLFTNIPFGEDFVVRVVAADPELAGFTPTVGPQSEGGFISNPVNLNASVTTVTDIDFGFDNASTIVINDRVWFDSDGDQTQDVGEPGISGVTVDLIDSAGDVVASTVTDGNGDFSFSGVPDGSDYRLVITDLNQELDGMNETTTTGGDQTISGLLSTAAADGILDTVGDDGTPTFGYNNPGSIAGTIWSDADSSEVQDNGEPGIGGVVVTLTPPSGVDLGNGVDQPITTVTAPDGSYIFDGLPPGDYQIDVLNPPAGVNTQDPDGDDDNNTSVTLGIGGGVVDQDFGYFDSNLNDINGTVFNDTDRDGVEEAGEPGIPGVSLDLIAVTPGVINGMIDINGDNVIDANDDGTYLGATIIDGNIDLDNSGVIDEADSGSLGTFSIVEGMVNIAMGIANQSSTGFEGDADPNVAVDGNPAGGTPVATVGPFIHTLGTIGTDYWEVDLGSIQSLGTLKVFNRDNTSNVRLENVRILVSDTPFPSDATDFAGAVSNADFVYQILAADLNDPEVALGGINARYIRLQKSGTDNVTNFLHIAELKITPALIPASSEVIASTVTDANGDYTFPGLPDGNYEVAVTDDATVLAGYDLTSGLDVLDASVQGADVNDVDFGYIKDAATGSISGEVFLDENGNNLAESTETNFSGVDVYLCSNPTASEPCDPTDPEFIASTVTNTLGEYAFTGLPSGSYLVDVDPADLPAGLSNTVDPAAVALAEGEIVEDVDFGYVPAANNGLLTGVVWTDTNGDGVIDPGEAPIAGVTISIFDPNSATPAVPIGTVDTDVDGKWEFAVSTGAGTLVDDLIVQYDAGDVPANLDSTQPTNLPDGITQYDTDNVDVASDADNLITDLNFGFEPSVPGSLGSISGTIYSDIDQNGDYSPATDGEFAGITIDLVDSSGNIISTTTDENGFYSFTGLQDDATGYSVIVTDLGNVLRDVNVNETITNPIPIVGGADVTDQDQGYISSSTPTLGSVGNLFFVDINMNGFADTGEPGVEGVTVQCWVDTDASATPNDPSVPVAAPDPEPGVDNLVRTVTTDANGEFYCTNLPAGQYIVRVTDTAGVLAGYTDTSPNNAADNPADNFAKPFTYALTSPTGTPNFTADFGVEANSEINGTVYFDENADGDFQLADNDIPQSGLEVQACNTAGLCINVFTEPDGSYSIPVGPGTWTVMVLNPPSGTDPLEVPATNPVTVAANTVVNEIDFGYIDKISVQPGTISGTVSEDTTGDGAGDTAIVGAIVELYTDPNGDGNPDDGVLVTDTTTDGGGAYSFTGLPATNTNYVVVEVDPADYASVSDAASTDDDVVANSNTNDNLIPVTLSPNEIDANNNFVDVRPGAISGSVWLDEDRDGINDIGEGSLTGIIIELRDDMGNLVATTTTDANGDYSFPGVVAGDYTVDVVDASVPAGLDLTAGSFGIDPRPVTVAAGETVEDQDFGYVSAPGVGAIGDRVWSDADGDGIQDAGEAGIEDVTLTLTDGTGAVVGTTMTNANGDYLFTNLPFGDDYVVSISPTDTVIVNAPNSAYVPTVGDQSEGGFVGHPVTLDPALTTVSDVDFGFNSPTSNNTITDTVWFDEDGDGVFDADEAPIPGVTVNLYADANMDGIPDDSDGDGQPDVIATATSDENGDVDFSGLPDGSYVLGVADTNAELNGLTGTTPGAITNFSATIPVAGGVPVDGDSFGYNNPGLIAGVVYNDADNNADQTPDEAGFASVAVTLLEDTDNNGSFETTVATIFTEPDGSYAFDGVPAGDYQIVVSAPAGTQSEDPDAVLDDVTDVSLAIGESSVANDFGYNNPSVNDVSGTVFEDTDKDGVEDAGEGGIANVTLNLVAPSEDVVDGDLDINGDGIIDATDDGNYLGIAVIDGQLDINGDGMIDANDDGSINGVNVIDGQLDTNGDNAIDATDDGSLPEAILATTTTDANGDYSFNDLPDGDYLVRVTDENQILPGYDITSGLDTLPVSLAGAPVTDVDFGYIREEATGSISGEVFVDEDGDGVADDEEANLPGVDVYLCTSPVASPPCDPTDPEFVAQTTTDANGDYVFTGLPADEYVIGVDPSDIPSGLNVTVSPPPVSVSEGEKVEDVDVGVEPAPNTGVMSGVVWVDADNDGNRDPGEAPIAGLTITIFDGIGNPLFTTDSAADGSWIVTGIPVVDGVSPMDLAVLYDPSDVPAGLNSVQPSNLPIGDTSYFDQDLGDDPDKVMSFFDFGFPPNVGTDLGSISGTIYSDADQDGSYLALTDGELPNVTLNLLDSGGNVIASTVTDENGDYSFTGLPDGDYTVVVSDLNNVVSGLNPNELLPATTTIAGGSDATDVNAGYQSDPDLGSIGNIFWFDTNRDGIKQESESGIEGITVQCWLDVDQSETPNDPIVATGAPQPGIDNLIRTAVTNDVGEYYCTSLPTGQYIVRVFDALDFNEADDGTLVTGSVGEGFAKPWIYALTTSSPNLTADFGVSGANSISGSVFTEDEELVESTDNVLDPGEVDGVFDGVNDAPAEGVPVVLYAVLGDGTLVEIQRTTTDASGDYSFTGLPDGNYRIEVEPDNSVIDGFGQTADPDLAGMAFPDNVCDSPTAVDCDNATGTPISLGGGASVVDVDFGYQKDFTTTPVTVNQFSAVRVGGGVNFTWESSNEVGHLGYQLYARAKDGWELINDELITSSSGGAMEVRQYSYIAYDIEATWFALIDVSAAEELTPHGPYRIDAAYGGALEQPSEFDWSGIKLNSGSSKTEIEASIRYRLERMGSSEQRAAARQ